MGCGCMEEDVTSMWWVWVGWLEVCVGGLWLYEEDVTSMVGVDGLVGDMRGSVVVV